MPSLNISSARVAPPAVKPQAAPLKQEAPKRAMAQDTFTRTAAPAEKSEGGHEAMMVAGGVAIGLAAAAGLGYFALRSAAKGAGEVIGQGIVSVGGAFFGGWK